jgi:hypothetical protein
MVVHRHRDCTQFRQTKEAHHELGRVAQMQGNPVALLDAFCGEQVGSTVYLVIELLIGELGNAGVGIMEDEEGLVAIEASLAFPKVTQGGICYDIGHGETSLLPSYNASRSAGTIV